jgi:hypothetical protein
MKLPNSRAFLFFLLFVFIFVVTHPPYTSPKYPKFHKQEVAHVSAKRLLNVGIGAYAIRSKNWKCNKFLTALDPLKEVNLAVVWDAFGTDNDCLLSVMGDPRLKRLEIIMINECCIRNGNCTPTEFLYGLRKSQYEDALINKDKKLMRRLKKFFTEVKVFLDTNLLPTTQCYISPGLESNLSDRAMNRLVVLSRKIIPQCNVIANPLYEGAAYNADQDLREFHGDTVPSWTSACVTDMDGLDISFPERPSVQTGFWRHLHAGSELQSYIKRAAKQCEVSFLWTWEMNCYNKGQKLPSSGRIAPAERECKAGNVYKLVVDQILLANQNTR